VNFNGSPLAPQSVLHAAKPQPSFVRWILRIKPDAFISDHQGNLITIPVQFNKNPVRSAVPSRVPQRFLDNPEKTERNRR
jgi:hypothetical protein